MAVKHLRWLLKPLAIENAPYKASIVAEHWENNSWVQLYSTDVYKSSDFYDVPVTDPDGNYRVRVDVSFYGRVTSKTSSVINFNPDDKYKMSIAYNADYVKSGVDITGSQNPIIVRTIPTKIQYEAFQEETINPYMVGILQSNTPVRTPQGFLPYTVNDPIINVFSALINKSKSTIITRQNGSSIGN